MSSISATVNGHSVQLTALPAWSQTNAYLLWQVYQQVLAVNARFPLNGISIVRVPSSVPSHFHMTIDGAANGDWVMHAVFNDPVNPLFGVEESHHTAWTWGQVEMTRELRSAMMQLLIENPDLIDSFIITLTP